MLIGIDIDGVLYPWDECARDALVEKFGIERPGPSTSWNYLKDTIAPEQWAWLWTPEGSSASFNRWQRTYPGVQEAFDAILGSGHECHFVTHRNPARCGLHTAVFLTHHFGHRPWTGLHVLDNSVPKHSLMEWDVFVDDKPETVLDMLVMTRAKVFAPVRPWNSELGDGGTYRSRRLTWYTDPRQVAEWVLAQ